MPLRSPLLLSAVALLAGCGGEEPSQIEKVCDSAAEECGDFIAPPVPYEETYGASVWELSDLQDRSPETVCGRLNADRVEVAPHPVVPGDEACDPGGFSAEGQAAGLQIINFYRWVTGLPPLQLFAGGNEEAQRCALVMSANGRLSHHPGASWRCNDAQSAKGALQSNIHMGRTGGGPPTQQPHEVLLPFLLDYGESNIRQVGHRRWILGQAQKQIALGYAWSPGSSRYGLCAQVSHDGFLGENPHPLKHVAWPAPGPFPISLISHEQKTVSWSVSWILQHNGRHLGPASARVTRLGAEEEVLENDLIYRDLTGFGGTAAVVFQPRWEQKPGRYRVEVETGAGQVSYETEIISCDG